MPNQPNYYTGSSKLEPILQSFKNHGSEPYETTVATGGIWCKF
jgi:hypothetical protein